MLYKLNEIDSTQKYLFENIDNFNINDAIYATRQTKGYGRTGVWESHEENIYFSLLVKNIKYSWLYVLCSMHIFCNNTCNNKVITPSNIKNNLKNLSNNTNLYIKIPNDVYYKHKKLGGFIIETVNDKLIIGVGINVYNTNPDFTSLHEICSTTKSIDFLCEQFYKTCMLVFSMAHEQLHNYFVINSNIINKNISFIDLKTKKCLSGIVNAIEYDTITINNIIYNMYQIKIIKPYL